MKSAMRHNIFKEIKSTFSRFMAIFAIVALGVGFFAGLKATAPVMKNTADRYFDEKNFMDIRLLSTMGFTDEDVAAVRNEYGIGDVMATYSLDTLVESKRGLKAVKIQAFSKDQEMNRPLLVEGRLPEKSGECVLDKKAATGDFGGIGSKIVISGENTDKTLDMLRTHEYTITGIVESPGYISIARGTTSIGNGSISCFLLIPREDFKSDCYLELFATVKGARELSSYSGEYTDLISNTKARLEALARDRETVRNNDIVGDSEKKLDKARTELAGARREAEDKLAAAREKLDKGAADIKAAEDRIKRSGQELSDARKQLADRKEAYQTQLDQTREKLDAAAVTIAGQRKEYEAGLAAVEEGRIKLAVLKQKIDELIQAGRTEEAGALSRQAAASGAELDASSAAMEQAGQKLEAAEAQLASGWAAMEAGKETAQAQFRTAQNKIDSGYASLKNGGAELAAAKADLESGRREYEVQKAEADKKLSDAQSEIDDSQAKINKLEKPVWYVLGRDTNPGFVGFGADADRIDAITTVFPIFFFLVAALVCLTTMARMVEEQRTQIGILKALGYNKAEIATKYLIYAGTATILGSAVGLAAGFLTFPSVIHKAYCIMYTLPPAILAFNVKYALISSLAAILCTTAATLWACYHELASVPAELVRPRAPSPGRRVLLEKIPVIWNRLSFIKKVTARNLLRYKKRFFMTVIGIGGCTALLLTGFGLMDSIMGIVSRQFGDIHTYDVIINLNDDGSSARKMPLNDELPAHLRESLYVMQASVDASSQGDNITAYLLVPENAEKLNDFVSFRDRVGKAAVAFPQQGKVVLSEKLAKKLHVAVGDGFTIKKGEFEKVKAIVGGITENYIYNYIYMNQEDYTAGFGKAAGFRQVLGKLPDTPGKGELTLDEEQSISAEILKLDNVSSVSFTSKSRREFGDTMKSLNSVVILLIISASLLAFVVLYNLTNVNITERIREIATIKVLGFFDKEVSAYVYRENLILTMIGMLAGLTGGIFLHQFVVQTAEVDMVMFERNIKPLSYVWSAIFAFAFAGLVNFIMYFKLRRISMVESLKSNE